MKILTKIGSTTIVDCEDGSYEWYSKMDVDNDGPNGNSEHDPDHDNSTSLKVDGKSVDSEKIKGIVIPESMIDLVKPDWLGSKALVTFGGISSHAVVYDFGPRDKIGEGSVALAKALKINPSPISGGVSSGVHFKVWPGISAIVDGVTYSLQPYKK